MHKRQTMPANENKNIALFKNYLANFCRFIHFIQVASSKAHWAIIKVSPLFLYFRLFNTVDSKQINVQYNSWPMTGFELQTSGVRSDRSTNSATTTALTTSILHNESFTIIL